MFRTKLYSRLSATAVFWVMLMIGVSAAWSVTYSDSVVVKKGKKGKASKLILVKGEVEARITKGSIDAYLKENSLNEVEIHAEMTEQTIDCDGGTGYQLSFEFGPSGLYFDVPLRLTIGGKYFNTECPVWLVDEAGNPLDGKAHEQANKIVFEIDHFSSYNYTDPSDEHPYAASYSVAKEIGIAGGRIKINSEANVHFKQNALADYLAEIGKDSVVITADLYYGWDGSLLFVFGPSGAHFSPEMTLEISGGYLLEDMTLVGEDGELLEYTYKGKGKTIVFKIPHFSRYAYDMYDY